MDGSILVNFVGAFERLEEDWIAIQKRIGIDPKPLPKKRISKRSRDYRDQYDDELTELVAAHFAQEIEAFGYSFEGGIPEGPLIGEIS